MTTSRLNVGRADADRIPEHLFDYTYPASDWQLDEEDSGTQMY